MGYRPTLLYSRPLPELAKRLDATIDRGCERYRRTRAIELFFRADDIGVPSRLFCRLIELFQHHQMPLCLAVVPSWLTAKRLATLQEITGRENGRWCWHQHGRRHLNFEAAGKKQEFGPARTPEIIQTELQRGLDRLHRLMGDRLSPFFTPPWNRCSLTTVTILKTLGFRALSRSQGARPEVSHILPDLPVNVDLHTRKEPTVAASLASLLTELEEGLASGRCGIMIHHQRMNDNAFLLLDLLLSQLARRPELTVVTFADLL
ncbi:MAG: polysaccharide deacetylase family protein [Desulfopila sp.]